MADRSHQTPTQALSSRPGEDRSRRAPLGTFLIVSQVFVPDPASVGQHLFDVACEMRRRGWRVVVYTSKRGYDDPTARYPLREVREGIEIRRIPFASFGKRSIPLRVLGTLSFMSQAILRVVSTNNVSGILFSTSPPLIGAVLAPLRWFFGLPLIYWAMDLNPDQLIAMRKIRPRSVVARVLEAVNRVILASSHSVVTLDRFMAGRLMARYTLRRLWVIPPWPHESFVEPVKHESNPFRERHNLQGKFVVMYSGNHSPANPLDTLLRAAVKMKDDPSVVFAFVGGGVDKRRVEQFVADNQLHNALCLPYQPLETLRYSLSAADVHVVSLGQDMVGIIHPCKVYGAMTVGRPVLFFGPAPSHVSDLLDAHQVGWHVEHGQVDRAVEVIQEIRRLERSRLDQIERAARRALERDLGHAPLCGMFCDICESAVRPSLITA